MNSIAMLIPTLEQIGGAERQLLLLAKGLRRRGWRVTVVTLAGSGGRQREELSEAGLEFFTLEMRKGLADLRGWVHFYSWLRRTRPDVLHAHLPHAAWMARWSRTAAPVRVVVDRLHSTSTGTWGRRMGYRWSDWLADGVTAVSQAVAEAHCAQRMVWPEKTTVLPNGIDVEMWRPDEAERRKLRDELGLTEDFLWLAAGRLEPVKNYPALLEAFAKLPKRARLATAGAGRLEAELRALAARLGIAGRVQFLGFEGEPRRWMQAADGFVLASRWEGLPMAVLEAGACGLPAVATDVPGTREAMVNGQTGLLTPAGSPAALADAMESMMRMSEVERRAMGYRARWFVEENFSLEKALDRWEALYDGLLRRNPAPKRTGSGRGALTEARKETPAQSSHA